RRATDRRTAPRPPEALATDQLPWLTERQLEIVARLDDVGVAQQVDEPRVVRQQDAGHTGRRARDAQLVPGDAARREWRLGPALLRFLRDDETSARELRAGLAPRVVGR